MKLTALAMVAILAASGASATTLDFSSVQGNNIDTVSVPGATINHADSGGTILVGPSAAGQADGFCFLELNAFSCEADGELIFDSAVTNLTFDIDGASAGDSVEISAYNGVSLLGSQTFTANGVADFSAFGAITRLFFDDSSTAAGVGYSTITFDGSAPIVPLPASLPLLLAGFGVLALRRRSSAA